MIARLLLAALAALLPLSAAADPIADWRAAHGKDVVAMLEGFARIDSVAASPAGLRRQAEVLEAELKKRGFAAQLLSANGSPPLVFGELKVKGAKRTVVFYAHYDGQPVMPSQWKTPPFEPVMREGTLDAPVVDWRGAPRLDADWRLFARSVSDDKAGIVAFLAAFDALRAVGKAPKVNLKVAWEGEEEAGSPNLAAILAANKTLFAADLWLIGDGPLHQSRRPTLYFGAGGVMGVEATVYGPVRALHDGHYGNWAQNPAAMAAELIASMRAPDGRVRIPGFADDIRPLTEAERAALAALPPVDEAMLGELALGAPEGDEALAASIMRPALNIRGISAGQVGDAAANAVPIEARVSIDFRLVPDQTPAKVRERVEAFLAAQGWTVVHETPDLATRRAHRRIVRLDWDDGYRALRSDMGSAPSRAAIRAAGGDAVALLPMLGGSVPIYLIDEILGAPLVGLPLANHDNNQHAANENLRLGNLWGGIDTYAAMMTRLDW